MIFHPAIMKDQTINIHRFYKKNQDFLICVAAYFIPFFLTQSVSQRLIPNYISIIFVITCCYFPVEIWRFKGI